LAPAGEKKNKTTAAKLANPIVKADFRVRGRCTIASKTPPTMIPSNAERVPLNTIAVIARAHTAAAEIFRQRCSSNRARAILKNAIITSHAAK
jgi:hypothetical protein